MQAAHHSVKQGQGLSIGCLGGGTLHLKYCTVVSVRVCRKFVVAA